MALPRLYVPSPNWSANPYGLFSVAALQSAADPHWQMGITYEPLCGNTPGVIINPCISPIVSGAALTKTSTANRNIRGALPFTATTWIDCGTVGNYDRVEQDTMELLRRHEQRIVEGVLWTGTAPNTGQSVYPHLAAGTAVYDGVEQLQIAATSLISVTGTGIVTALGQLEDALADCYGGQGVIHMTYDVAEAAISNFLIQRVPVGPGGKPALQTVAGGNWVVVGAGYTGTSPSGAAPPSRSEWMYATGAVFYYRGDIKSTSRPSEAVVRSINDLVYIAERTYVVAWDCCLIGALVTLS